MKTVFLSSTGKDLSEYRDAVCLAIQRLKGFHCIRMEDFIAADNDSLNYCLDAVAECDVFVGMIGHYYGSCPKSSEKSFTQLEYERAQVLSKPRLMFVAPDNFLVPANLREPEENHQKQQAFRRAVMEERVVSPFNSPGELALQVATSICNYLLQTFSGLHNNEESFIIISEGARTTNVTVEMPTEGCIRLSPNPQDTHISRVTIISQKSLNQASVDFSSGIMPKGTKIQRASGGYYHREIGGQRDYAKVNTPRFEEIDQGVKCLLVEPARTNLILNSEAPDGQILSLFPGIFTLWIEGEGSAEVKSGVDGTATEHNPFTFTLDAPKKVEINLHGVVNRFQLETGPYPTSYLPTTRATMTRAGDILLLEVAHILANPKF